MPGPSPETFWINTLEPLDAAGTRWRVELGFLAWADANEAAQRVRAARLCANYSRGWHCPECGELVPVWKRADAVYCREACRKAAARSRKAKRAAEPSQRRETFMDFVRL